MTSSSPLRRGGCQRPLMVNPKNALVYGDYGIDSSKPNFKLEEASEYQKVLRDTNCAYIVSKTGRAEYSFLDGKHSADSPNNITNRLVAYKNEQVFGQSHPQQNAKPLPAALEKIEKMYSGGKMVTKAEAEKMAKEDHAKGQAIYWEGASKAENMPDRYMITYTGVDSNGRNYISVQPNWNRYFMLQPNNMCSIATRHSLYWD